MTSLRERMRESRDRTERLTESQRTLTVELQQTRDRLHEVNNALYGLRRSLTWLRILGPLIYPGAWIRRRPGRWTPAALSVTRT